MHGNTKRVFVWETAIVVVGAGAALFGYMAGQRHEPKPMQGLVDKITAPVPYPPSGRMLTDMQLNSDQPGPNSDRLYALSYERTIVIELPPICPTNIAQSIVSFYTDHFIQALASEGISFGSRGGYGSIRSIAREKDGTFRTSGWPETVTLYDCARGYGNRIEIIGRVFDFDGQSRHLVPGDSLMNVPAKGQRVLQLDISIMAHGFTQGCTRPFSQSMYSPASTQKAAAQ